jgi:hypothetical protein
MRQAANLFAAHMSGSGRNAKIAYRHVDAAVICGRHPILGVDNNSNSGTGQMILTAAEEAAPFIVLKNQIVRRVVRVELRRRTAAMPWRVSVDEAAVVSVSQQQEAPADPTAFVVGLLPVPPGNHNVSRGDAHPAMSNPEFDQETTTSTPSQATGSRPDAGSTPMNAGKDVDHGGLPRELAAAAASGEKLRLLEVNGAAVGCMADVRRAMQHVGHATLTMAVIARR